MNEDRNLCETLYAPRAPSPEAPAWPVRPAFVPSNIRLAIGRDPARANEFQGPHGEIRRLRAKSKNCFFNKTRNARAKLNVIWNALSASSPLPRVTTFRTSHEFFGLIVDGSPAGQPDDQPFFAGSTSYAWLDVSLCWTRTILAVRQQTRVDSRQGQTTATNGGEYATRPSLSAIIPRREAITFVLPRRRN